MNGTVNDRTMSKSRDRDQTYDRYRQAYCVRVGDGSKVAWSASTSFSAAGYHKLTEKQVKVLAAGTHTLRDDIDEVDKKPHLNLRRVALETTASAMVSWHVDGITLQQQQSAIEQQMVTLNKQIRGASRKLRSIVSQYDEETMSAKERTISMKEQSTLKRAITSTTSKVEIAKMPT